MVPGRPGKFFREEIVRKDENGEDLEVYSDVRRGPLVCLLELSLTRADNMYASALLLDAKGDAGLLRYGYGRALYSLTYMDQNNNETTVKLSQGLYEGYLQSGFFYRSFSSLARLLLFPITTSSSLLCKT